MSQPFSPTTIQNLLERQAIQLAADCCTEVADALLKSEDGTLSVGFTFKLTKTNDRVHCVPSAMFSLRTKIEGEEDSEPIKDENQPELMQ